MESLPLLESFVEPAALLDEHGVLTAVNEAWRRFDQVGALAGAPWLPGVDFGTAAARRLDAQLAPAGELERLAAVLAGERPEAALSYRTESGLCFRLRLSRLRVSGRPAALLVHLPAGPEAEALHPSPAPDAPAEGARLRDARRLQQGILDSIPDIAWLKDADGRFLAVSRAFTVACGLAAEVIAGKTDLDVWENELAERYRSDDREVMASRQTRRVEEPLRDQSGRLTWIETIKVPIVNDQGEAIGTAGIARDITERKEAELGLLRSNAELERLVIERTAALHRANETLVADLADRTRIQTEQRRFVATLESTTGFVAMADLDGVALFINQAGRRLAGLDESRPARTIVIADCHPAWAYKVILEQGIPGALRDGFWSGETALLSASGQEIPIWQHILAHRDERGEPEFLSTIALDLRERRVLEQQLLQSQKIEAMGRLAGGIAHDFNNLLTAILGNSELCLLNMEAEDPNRLGVMEITAAAMRAAQLTAQLLAFARKQRIEPRLVDPNRLILDNHTMLRRLIGERVEIVTIPGVEAGIVRVDPSQLQQILLNLALNARDAMPEGGKLTIETARVEIATPSSRQPEVPPGSYVRLTVTDTGVGMDDEVLAHVFEPFFTTKAVGRGTGLGLASCHGIVKQAGGYIEVESHPLRGTTFRIHLPRVAVPLPETREAPPAPVVGGSETVLLAEDEPHLRGILEKVLSGLGYRLLVASNGLEAICRADEHPGEIHLLLTDLVMPQLGGRDAAARIAVSRPSMRVLFMSGYATGLELGQLSPLGQFLAKPFGVDALALRVREILDQRR